MVIPFMGHRATVVVPAFPLLSSMRRPLMIRGRSFPLRHEQCHPSSPRRSRYSPLRKRTLAGAGIPGGPGEGLTRERVFSKDARIFKFGKGLG